MLGINICGRTQHGKTTLAQYIAEECQNQNIKTLLISNADPIKEFVCHGLGVESIEDKKCKWSTQYGCSHRELLVGLGEGLKHSTHNPAIWACMAAKKITLQDHQGKFVIKVDDRFPSEIEVSRDWGLKMVYLNRPDMNQTEHDSDRWVDRMKSIADFIVINTCLQSLRTEARTIVGSVLKPYRELGNLLEEEKQFYS